jgi:hypothetical protein
MGLIGEATTGEAIGEATTGTTESTGTDIWYTLQNYAAANQFLLQVMIRWLNLLFNRPQNNPQLKNQ